MALQKSITIDNITCKYWRIVGFNVSITGKIIQVFLVGYKDLEGRKNKQNLVSINYTVKQDNFNTTFNALTLVSGLYLFLKNNIENFKNADDV